MKGNNENHEKILNVKGKRIELHTRPNATPGFWLCTLLPLCFLVNIHRDPNVFSEFDYRLITFTVIGCCLQSISFFLYLNFKSNSFTSSCYAFIPSAITSLLIYYFVKQNVIFSILFAFITLISIYQYMHLKILQCFSKSFTLGEASVVLQGLLLFMINAVLKIPKFWREHPETQLGEMQAIMITALFALLVLGLMVYIVEALRKPIFFYCLMTYYVLFVCLMPVTKDFPIVIIWNFITSDSYRIIIIIFYFGLVMATAAAIIWRLNKSKKATTSIRKIFHVIVVLVFLPGLLYECTLLYIASGVALSFLIIFEMLRVLEIPPFYEHLDKMIKLFVDEKDAGLFAFTPIYLLVGCSLPLWINPNPCSIPKNLIQLLSGIVSIGIGDTAASVIGSRYGEVKWPGTKKSIEGTLANVISQSVVIIILFILGCAEMPRSSMIFIQIAIIVTSFIEAFTDQVDNLVLPLVFYIISSLD